MPARIIGTLWCAVLVGLALVSCGGADGTSLNESAAPKAVASAESSPRSQGSDLLDTVVSGQGFTVRMPGDAPAQPNDAVDPSGKTIRGQLHFYEDGANGYGIGHFPLGTRDRYDLTAAVKAAAERVGGRVVTQRPVQVLGHPARDCQIVYEDEGDTITMFSRFVRTPARVFILQYLGFGKRSTNPPAEFRFFVESFRLTAPDGAAA